MVEAPRSLSSAGKAPAPRRQATPSSALSSRELGLDLALILARYLCKTDHLHYGYWSSDMSIELANLKEAQERYTDLLVSHIPEGVESILEVGIGSGALTHRLIQAGYRVDCVSPSPYLTARARELLGDGPQIFECRYEDLQTPNRYDLILFSESFQYVRLDKAISISEAHVCPEGYVLISDFFRKETTEDGPIKGGHRLHEMHRLLETCTLRLMTDRDITDQTAPNLDLLNDFSQRVIVPVKERLFGFLAQKYPLPYRALYGMLRKHLRHAETKYLSGQRNGAAFRKYKTYRVLLFQQGCPGSAAAAPPRLVAQSVGAGADG